MDQAANLRRLVLETDKKLKKTKTIAITSGKGGVGKTSVAVSLSIALARGGSTVTLLDADLGLANINVILGIIPKYNLYHVIKGPRQQHIGTQGDGRHPPPPHTHKHALKAAPCRPHTSRWPPCTVRSPWARGR